MGARMCGLYFLVQSRIRRTHATHTLMQMANFIETSSSAFRHARTTVHTFVIETPSTRPACQTNYRQDTCKSRTRVYHEFAAINPSSRLCHTDARASTVGILATYASVTQHANPYFWTTSGCSGTTAINCRACVTSMNRARRGHSEQIALAGDGGDCIDSPK